MPGYRIGPRPYFVQLLHSFGYSLSSNNFTEKYISYARFFGRIMMKVDMQERPKHPIIIEGFPGFGFVGTIATEFLIKHLKAQPIGKIWSSSLMPSVAIHGGKPVDPLGVYYDKKTNIVIFHAISNVNGMEWELSDTLYDLAR